MRPRREPIQTDLPAALSTVVLAATEYREAAGRADAARAALVAALSAAHAAGASYSQIGRLAGMSRQAVTQAIDSSAEG